MSTSALELTKSELFARVASPGIGAVTVITPNRRLAEALAHEIDLREVAGGRTTWETPDILPYTAFAERLYEDALYSEVASWLPLLLTPDQEQSLWEEVLRRSEASSELLAVPETAALAREAWELAHAWDLLDQLRDAHFGEDAAAFAHWARGYEDRTKRARLTDRARLPTVLADALDHPWVRKPQLLVAYGFDIITPQQHALFDELVGCGVKLARCAPTRCESHAIRVAAVDANDEVAQAAHWARTRLEANPSARMGIVVPDLSLRKSAMRHALTQALAPGNSKSALPFNISLGNPLAAYPLVAHALYALELGGREIEFEHASLILRSPFIAGAESELHRRAILDARLRRRAEPVTALDRLAGMIDDAPLLAEKLRAYAEFRTNRLIDMQSPGGWARSFTDALAILGFPGERVLDSAEVQTLNKWHELLTRFGGLEEIVAAIGFDDALARLRRMAAGTLFQPETPHVPIQVLGLLEARGMTFDHLWVTSLSDEVWPMQARPNPFIPLRIQRTAGVLHGSPASTLEFARRVTSEWLTCASEVVLSHPQREEDRDLAASPLISDLPQGSLELPEHESWRDAIHRSAKVERILDVQAPALMNREGVRGGVSLIKDQAACPFRAFAKRRLDADGIESPHTGLDPSERGHLVHQVLASVWKIIKTKRALDALDESSLQALVAGAADEAITAGRRKYPGKFGGRFAAVEKARLVRVVTAWLAYERSRGEFEVVATEDLRSVSVGPLQLKLRLDRIDETESGARIIIDYKTGRISAASMYSERPDEPQLPLYVTAAEPNAAAVAFAQVRIGEMKLVGLARDKGLPAEQKLPARPDWEDQIARWRSSLDRLAHGFASGCAEVDPKKLWLTCRNCDLQPLCRIYERIGSAEEGSAE